MNDKTMTNPTFTDQSAEQLSALMDGELAADQVRFLLRGVEAQSDLARRWSNYQVISASLKREYIAVQLPPDFAAGILDRLDADLSAEQASAVLATRRIGLGALRWVGGGAIAAAVAVVALVVSRPVGDNGALAGVVASAPFVQQASSRPAYLPLQPAATNFVPGSAGFNARDVSPASYDSISGLPTYFTPKGSLLRSADAPVAGTMPSYILQVVPARAPNVPQTTVPVQP
jgi:negative regulator of sigma E activity